MATCCGFEKDGEIVKCCVLAYQFVFDHGLKRSLLAELIELQFLMLCEQHVDHVVLRFKRILEGIHAGLEHANLLFQLILAWLFYKNTFNERPGPVDNIRDCVENGVDHRCSFVLEIRIARLFG